MIDLFRATGLSREHAGGGVGHEDIKVHLVKVHDLDAWLQARHEQGMIIDVKMYLASAYLQRR